MSALTLKIRETYTDHGTGKTKSHIVATAMHVADAAALVVMSPKTRSVVYNGRVLWSPRQSTVMTELQDGGRDFVAAMIAVSAQLRSAIDTYWAERRAAAGLGA